MWPSIPENLSTLTAAALRELANEIRTAALAAMAKVDKTPEERAEIAAYGLRRVELIELADAVAEVEAEDAAEATRAAEAAAAADAAAEAAAAEPEVVPPAEVEVIPTPPAALATTTGVESTPSALAVRSSLEMVQAAAGLPNKTAGEGFSSWAELAQSVFEAGKSMTGGTRKTEVARIVGDFGPERQLERLDFSLPRFERDEIMAAACAPATPYYGLACQNSLARPTAASLPSFQAPRGKVSVAASPTLADITGQTNPGYDNWTFADDDDANAVKNCAVVSCNSFTEYEMYAVWRCLTVKNMMMMTYPELVEAYLNRLAAAWSRLAETLLLNAMATGTTKINAKALGYGATTTLTSTLLEYLALYQETQRWDITDNMEVWAHRYILTGIQMDLMRRRNTSGSVPRVATESEINAIFANAGFNMHWVMDTATWMTPVSAVATGVNLNSLPVLAQFLIAPPGKFAMIDRGELAIGVNGNHLYRDNTSNSRNQFTLFWENFEGIVNTTSCPAHIVDIPLCWNGIQVDDQLVNCAGQNMPGFQS